MKKMLAVCLLALVGGDLKAQCYSGGYGGGGYSYRPSYQTNYGYGYAPSYNYAPAYSYYAAHWYNGRWYQPGYYYQSNGVYYLKDYGAYYGLSYDPTYNPPPASAVLYPGGTQFVGVPPQSLGLAVAPGGVPGFQVGGEPKYSLQELFTINQFRQALANGQQVTTPTFQTPQPAQQPQQQASIQLTQEQMIALKNLADFAIEQQKKANQQPQRQP